MLGFKSVCGKIAGNVTVYCIEYVLPPHSFPADSNQLTRLVTNRLVYEWSVLT